MKIHKVNWSQATVEVLLLLAGAGVALGLDACNDERLERRAEAEYLVFLKSDIEQTRDNFQWAVDGNAALVEDNLGLLRLLSGPPGSVPLDSISRRHARNFWIYEFDPILGTYYDLLNSGKLELLRSDSLRYALTQFESELDRLEIETDQTMLQWWDLVAPFFSDRVSFSEFMDLEYRGADFPQSRFPLDPTAYWSQEFENVLTFTVVARQQLARSGEARLVDLDTILRLIEKAQVNF